MKVKEKSDFLQLIKDLNIFIFSRYFCRQQTPGAALLTQLALALEQANAVKFAQERQEGGFDFTSRGHRLCLSMELLKKMPESEASFRNSVSSLHGGETPQGNWVACPSSALSERPGQGGSSASWGEPSLLHGELPHSSLLGFRCGLDGWHPRRTPVQCHAEASVNSGSSSCYQCWEEI